MVSKVPMASRPPESTLEPAWALVLPRTRPALVVCALELRISTETFGEGSGPTQASALGWGGHLGVMLDDPKAPCILVQGGQRETETLESQADRHTVGSDA